ncbi:3-deoxy-7-phosphoheptulonate synthase [Serpentinicella sp. ANB-PHB4]|uniref:3-deoxy-7-phosphoheptulonate synthase n=1 Tax=Serpentinicella sp. ANB-PHB4 TaxID=3074076 RepID=UPI00285B6776|nr:3-deoxy-7-phosphoheptulonate synthase [Serpentinicella sp. ANB-PHB4]MDR5658610.1 3-deoxy-7-phosphoheptulonate synthase [Serpentinicella sp. ANB-PHB4]
MVIVMKANAPNEVIERIEKKMTDLGCQVHRSEGANYCLLGLVGDTSRFTESQILANEFVDRVIRVQQPFKLAGRMFHPEDTIIKIGNVEVGQNTPCVIAGPCSVENEEQLLTIAKAVKSSGATMLRGGAFKPRTSPYSFQGLGEEGLKLLQKAKEETGLPIVTEVMDTDTFDLVESYADVLQIGARNMQNFPLLKRAGRSKKPIILKRGLSATIEEFLMSAEYIMSEGNSQVILCERGIRTFETHTRNTLDLSAVPAIKELSHLPIIVDPSHACGKWALVEPLAKAAIAVGAHGLMIEVHHEPEQALSDGSQSLKPKRFDHMMKAINEISKVVN